ncbi:MAG: hypothetical protein ACI9FN_002431 [Saprospiraceae bacterium]|jgi:hypothetical protein
MLTLGLRIVFCMTHGAFQLSELHKKIYRHSTQKVDLYYSSFTTNSISSKVTFPSVSPIRRRNKTMKLVSLG